MYKNNRTKVIILTFILLSWGLFSGLAFSSEGSISDIQSDTFKRYFIATDLKDPNLGPEYKKLLAGKHWADIVEWMHSQGVIDLEIYLFRQRLAMIFETKPDFHLQTFKDNLHALPLYKEWQKKMKKFLKPLPQAEEGEAWTLTERVYELEQKKEYRNTDGYVKKRPKMPVKKICEARELVTDPNLLQKYKELHAIGMAWPEITQSIKDTGIIELEIYMVGNRTFEFYTVPKDFDWDTAFDESYPSEKEKEWAAIMGPIDKPFTDENGNQLNSQVMERIFKSTAKDTKRKYNMSPKTEELIAAIEEAYASSPAEQLEAFFRNWHKSARASNLSTIENQEEKDVYQVYLSFFDPFNLARVGKSEWGNDIYKDVSYVVIQDSIQYVVKSEESRIEHTITNFRPPVNFSHAKALFLTPEYREALLEFLGSENIPMGTGNLMSPARAAGESKKRLNFLNQYIKIHHGHWGGWHLETHPLVGSVVFDQQRTKAAVYFRIVYQGGESDFQREKSGWVLKKSGLTWIE